MSSLGSIFSEAGAKLLADLEEENKRLREKNLKLVSEMKRGEQAQSVIADIMDLMIEEYADDLAQILGEIVEGGMYG